MSDLVAAMNLHPGDVAHIHNHTCHGQQVNCGDHHVEVTDLHPEFDNVVIDYRPMAEWPGCTFHSGRVVYSRTDRIEVVWHADDVMAMARGYAATLQGMVA